MRIAKSILWAVAVVLCACTHEPESVVVLHECASVPCARACAAAFVAEGEAYVFGGRDSSGAALNDMWRYNPATDSWECLGATPLSKRVHAAACVAEGKVYLGLGFDGRYGQDSSYLQDWWQYTPSTQEWKRLADYPNCYTDRATAFAGDGALYVGFGFCWNYRRDMFRYDVAADRWDSIDVNVSFHGFPTRSFGGTGCSCQGRYFMGTGFYKGSLDWWGELVDGTHWEQRSPVPGRTRTLAASAATKDYIYLSAGMHFGGANTTGEVLRDVRRYDPASDRWTYVATLPEGLMNHVSFAVGKRVYIGLGEIGEWQTTDKLYYFEE